jgi:Family of unknown function (DUF6455)
MSTFDFDLPLDERLKNMSDMIGRLGIDPAPTGRAGGDMVLASAVRACEACSGGTVCRDWLLRAAPTLYRAPPFCPNTDRFAQPLAGELAARRAATT